jgi:hypothetical protein
MIIYPLYKLQFMRMFRPAGAEDGIRKTAMTACDYGSRAQCQIGGMCKSSECNPKAVAFVDLARQKPRRLLFQDVRGRS